MWNNTPTRKFRCPDTLWEAAKTKAEHDNTTVSEQIRAFLETWTTEGEATK